jgi:hypothetical protein
VTVRAPLLVAGGRQRRAAGVADRDHRALYDLAVLGRLEPGVGIEPVLEHVDDDFGDPRELGHRFGAPSLDAEGLVLCTERAVLRVDPSGRILGRHTHPHLADVHHALRIEGVLHAVATGADVVVRLGDEPASFPVADGVEAPGGDLRCAPRRRSPWHANHAFVHDGAVFVTRGAAGDAAELGGTVSPAPRRWPLADVVVHDGLVRPEGVWFTAVDGRLLLVDPRVGRVVRAVVLRHPDDGEAPLGWCRGLAIDGDTAYVGFTRLRATRARRNLAWIARHLRGTAGASARPTRIEAWDLRSERRIGAWPTASAGLDAIFGMVRDPA